MSDFGGPRSFDSLGFDIADIEFIIAVLTLKLESSEL